MKLKSKLIIASAALITISGAAAGTSTFAWFTASRNAYTELNATVETRTDTLKIALNAPTTTVVATKKAGDTNPATADSGNTVSSVTFAAGTIGTDISGDGVTFYKPVVNAAAGNDTTLTTPITSCPEVHNDDNTSDAAAKVYYQQYRLTFTHTNTAITTGVFLSSNSTLTNTATPTTTDIANAYRVAILDENAGSLIAYYAPNEDTTGLCEYVYTPFVDATTTPDLASVSQTTSAAKLGIGVNNFLGHVFDDVTDAATNASKATGNGYLGEIDAGHASLTITVRIWCEGNDPACTNAVYDQKVNSTLVFNGVNMTISQ